MPTCRDGHDSTDPRHCDVCGRPIGDVSRPVRQPRPEPPPAARWQCPRCQRNWTGRYCEIDGYDSLLPSGAGSTAAPEPVVAAPVPAADWFVVAAPDRGYFDFVCAAGGGAAAQLTFPPYCPERRFQLRGPKVLIGRRSAARGIDPEIDLTGPPEDLAVGRAHALLLAQPDRTWTLVDLDSVNHTYVNDYTGPPLKPNLPVPVTTGDRIYLGAWTVLTLSTTP